MPKLLFLWAMLAFSDASRAAKWDIDIGVEGGGGIEGFLFGFGVLALLFRKFQDDLDVLTGQYASGASMFLNRGFWVLVAIEVLRYLFNSYSTPDTFLFAVWAVGQILLTTYLNGIKTGLKNPLHRDEH